MLFFQQDMGNHVVLFVFSEGSDVDRVLLGESWSYDKHLVSIQRLEKNVSVRDLAFDWTSFWVQIHDLPVGDMNPEEMTEIESIIGEV